MATEIQEESSIPTTRVKMKSESLELLEEVASVVTMMRKFPSLSYFASLTFVVPSSFVVTIFVLVLSGYGFGVEAGVELLF